MAMETADTRHAIRIFEESSNDSRRKYKIGLGVGVGALVVGGVIIGLYFGGVLHKSSSSSSAPSCSTSCQQAYASWQTYFNKSGASTTPSSTWINSYNAAIAANPSVSGDALNQELGIFANLSPEEFASSVTRSQIDPKNHDLRANLPVQLQIAALGENAPASLDWSTDPTATSPVKDQAQCGGCWAFATAEAVESAYGRANNVAITPLSPQQIISCDTGGNNKGCNGGDPAAAINNYLKGHPLGTEANYPFSDGAGQTSACNTAKQATAATTGVKVTGLTYATASCSSRAGWNYQGYNCAWSQADEDNVKAALQKGPISIAVDASGWNSYKGGIVDGSGSNGVKCTSVLSDIDHAVQLVGYGTDKGVDYWLVKNQWTTRWGEKGYIRLKRGQNTCCVLCDAIQATTSGVPAGSPTGSPATNAPTNTPTTAGGKTTTSAGGNTNAPVTTFPPTQPPTSNPCNSVSCPKNAYCDASSGNAQCYCNSGFTVSNGACVAPSTSSPSGGGAVACTDCSSTNCPNMACGTDSSTGKKWCCPSTYRSFSVSGSSCTCGASSSPSGGGGGGGGTAPSGGVACSARSSSTPNCGTMSGKTYCCAANYDSFSISNGKCTCTSSSGQRDSGNSVTSGSNCVNDPTTGTPYVCWQCQSSSKVACTYVAGGSSNQFSVSDTFCSAAGSKPSTAALGC